MTSCYIWRMASIKRINFTVGSFLLLLCLASFANAQQHTFISGLGSDSDPCTRTDPCRTFGQAISQTSAGGEVIVLDSANFGPAKINKSISLIAPPGVFAGVSVSSADGIDINAGPSDTVVLRGLTVENQWSSSSGIVFNTGKTLHIESCVVNGFANGSGVLFKGGGMLEVKDSIMRGNLAGINVIPLLDTDPQRRGPGTAVATIDGVRLEGGTVGLGAHSGSKVTVRNSIASANFAGFSVGATSAPVEVNIEDCVASNNINFGIFAGKLAADAVVIVRVSNSTVTDNSYGLFNDHGFGGSLLLSRGNNTVEGNSVLDTSGTIGSYSSK